MTKIRKLNAKIAKKDLGRVVFGTISMVVGTYLWGRVIYGRGVTACQGWMCKTFPEEYESMTIKVAEMLEQEH